MCVGAYVSICWSDCVLSFERDVLSFEFYTINLCPSDLCALVHPRCILALALCGSVCSLQVGSSFRIVFWLSLCLNVSSSCCNCGRMLPTVRMLLMDLCEVCGGGQADRNYVLPSL